MDFLSQHSLLKDEIETYLQEVFLQSQAPSELIEAMEYSLLAGGKRIRPSIALYMAREFEISDDTALPLCAALEMIHTYSLIHDDLPAMDDDDLRRGMPTNHVKFGEAMAILAGDGLLNSAFELMLKNCPVENAKAYVEAVRYIAECAGVSGMIGGQVMDMNKTPDDFNELIKMHSLKTGRMFSASFMPMVILKGISEDVKNTYLRLSENIGLLFQITDDILDVKGEAEILGKTIGKDENSGKITYVTQYGIDEAEKMADEVLKSCLDLLKEMGKKHEYLRSLAQYIRRRNN